MKKNASKSAAETVKKMTDHQKSKSSLIQLPVKVGRYYVYLSSLDDTLSVGPLANGLSVESFFHYNENNLDKRTRRLTRKALSAIGRSDLAAQSVAEHLLPRAVYVARREDEIRSFTRDRYAENCHGDYSSHTA